MGKWEFIVLFKLYNIFSLTLFLNKKIILSKLSIINVASDHFKKVHCHQIYELILLRKQPNCMENFFVCLLIQISLPTQKKNKSIQLNFFSYGKCK